MRSVELMPDVQLALGQLLTLHLRLGHPVRMS